MASNDPVIDSTKIGLRPTLQALLTWISAVVGSLVRGRTYESARTPNGNATTRPAQFKRSISAPLARAFKTGGSRARTNDGLER